MAKPFVPIIVADQAFISQTVALSPVAIFTPASDDLFRISAYLETGSTDTSAQTRCNLSWTDDFRTNAPGGFTFYANGSPLSGPSGGPGAGDWWATVIIRAKAGTPISVATETIGTLAIPYNLYIVIESL